MGNKHQHPETKSQALVTQFLVSLGVVFINDQWQRPVPKQELVCPMCGRKTDKKHILLYSLDDLYLPGFSYFIIPRFLNSLPLLFVFLGLKFIHKT